MKILLATDGSATAEAALQVVLSRSWQAGSEVKVISVVEPLSEKLSSLAGLFGLSKAAADSRNKFIQDLKVLMESWASKLKQKFGEDKVGSEILEGRIKETIVAEAAKFKADIIIMGAHGRSEYGEFLFGNVPEYVLSHACCSVEILRTAGTATMVSEFEGKASAEESKYLLALDDSEFSAATLKETLQRQWSPQGSFRVLSAVEPLPFQAYAGLGPWEGAASEEYLKLVKKTMEVEQSNAQKLVDKAVASLKEKFPGMEVSGQVVSGYARDSILSAARDWPADLIIMGSHGRSGFMEFMLGSVSKACSAHAPCSVLIVRSSGGKGHATTSSTATASSL